MTKLCWHKIIEHCPNCHETLTIISVSFSADGRFLVDWYCLGEQIRVHTQYMMAGCICKAFEADMEQSFLEPDLRPDHAEVPEDDGAD
jgi:hypothetical protein